MALRANIGALAAMIVCDRVSFSPRRSEVAARISSRTDAPETRR